MMKSGLSLNIRQKITLTFISVIILLCGNAFLGISINRNSNKISSELDEVYYPLIEKLKMIYSNQKQSADMARSWVYNNIQDDKQALKELVLVKYPKIRLELGEIISLLKNQNFNRDIKNLIEVYDELVLSEIEIMDILTTSADFENTEKINISKDLLDKRINPVLSENNENYDMITRDLNIQVKQLNNKKKQMAQRYDIFTYIITGIIIFLIIVLIILLPGIIINRITYMVKFIGILNEGNIPDKIKSDKNDEIGDLEKELTNLSKNMNSVRNFAVEIGKGNFNTNENVFGNKGAIGSALDEMRKSLIEIADKQDLQRKEEEIRNWMTAGFAQFNEILRSKTDNINDLAYELVKELVKYTNSILGGVYISKRDENNQEKLVMSGLFAYERKRYVDTEFEPGEGLIGTCYIEKHLIYMRDIPEDYLKISSGLGETPPRELLIVPLISNDNIFGVVEMATLNTYNENMIEFVEKVAEGLASTISSVVANMETARLLKESQEQGEQLRSQEEELRQNMEEIQAAQDEMHRKQQDLEKALETAKEKEASILTSEKEIEVSEARLQVVIDNLPIAVYWKDKNLVYKGCNEFFAKKVKKERPEDLIGRTDYEIQKSKQIADLYRKEDEQIIESKQAIRDVITKKKGDDGKFVWSKVTKLPLLDQQNRVIGILGLIADVTERMSNNEANKK